MVRKPHKMKVNVLTCDEKKDSDQFAVFQENASCLNISNPPGRYQYIDILVKFHDEISATASAARNHANHERNTPNETYDCPL